MVSFNADVICAYYSTSQCMSTYKYMSRREQVDKGEGGTQYGSNSDGFLAITHNVSPLGLGKTELIASYSSFSSRVCIFPGQVPHGFHKDSGGFIRDGTPVDSNADRIHRF